MSMNEETRIGQLEDRVMVAEKNVKMLHELLKAALADKSTPAPALLRSPYAPR
jgi:hypothetical protein